MVDYDDDDDDAAAGVHQSHRNRRHSRMCTFRRRNDVETPVTMK